MSHRHRKHRDEQQRYYLLPGMGGSALRRKRMAMIKAGLGVGLFIALLLGLILWLMNRDPR